MENKYHELDKSISKQIMKEFKGKSTEVVCPDCHGRKYWEFGNPRTGQLNSVIMCDGCNGTGKIICEW